MKHDEHDHHEGLAHDLRTISALRDRRQALRLLAGMSIIPLLGCGESSETTTGSTSGGAGGGGGGGSGSSGSGGSDPGKCSNIPEETAGPYPGDGSNGANALTTSGILRSDIRGSFGGMSGTAAGVPLSIKLTLVNTKAGCAALSGYAIYLWHCDRDGNYSLYTVSTENYLRGLQETDASGAVTFSSIFPGCYSGRFPHIHFEVFPSVAKATAGSNKLNTSQLALPADVCSKAYATSGYEKSVSNLAMTSLASDMVFSDGASLQIPTMTGNPTDGYVAALTVGIAV